MANNAIPHRFDLVVEHLEDSADGAQAHGAAINLKQNDEPALRAILAELVGTPAGPGNVPPAVPGLKDKWNVAKAGKVSGTAAFRSAKSNGRALARACMGVLKPTLGDRWNNAWQAAGFTNHSLAVPDNPLALLQQILLCRQPGQGSAGPDPDRGDGGGVRGGGAGDQHGSERE